MEAQPVARSLERPPLRRRGRSCRQRPDLRIDALGSGSDYTVFVDHLGIASLNLGFSGEDGGGIYHSIYDDYYWYTRFSDGDFVYGRALAQTIGSAVLRLAGAEVLPFDFSNLAETVNRYVDELQKLWKSTADRIKERNREIDEGVFSATSDPRRPTLPPLAETVPPFLNFAPLENGAAALSKSAERYEKALAKATLAGRNLVVLECEADSDGTWADGSRGPPAPPVVPAPALRAGLLYGLRRKERFRRSAKRSNKSNGRKRRLRSRVWVRCCRTKPGWSTPQPTS